MLENRTNGNYSRNFMLIDFATHTLRLYPEEAEFASDLSKFQVEAEINCQYITKASVLYRLRVVGRGGGRVGNGVGGVGVV